MKLIKKEIVIDYFIKIDIKELKLLQKELLRTKLSEKPLLKKLYNLLTDLI